MNEETENELKAKRILKKKKKKKNEFHKNIGFLYHSTDQGRV